MNEWLARILIFLTVLFIIRTVLRWVLDGYLRRENRFVLFMHKGGLGDAFCQTALIRALGERYPGIRITVLTLYPDFYHNLPPVSNIVDLRYVSALRRRMLFWSLRSLRLNRAHDFVYRIARDAKRTPAPVPGRPHLVAMATRRLRLPVDLSDPRGVFRAYSKERTEFEAKYAHLGEFALVVPIGKTSYTPNKDWGSARFGAVVAAMPEVNWVRLGLAGEPVLAGATDLCGKTSLREMAWLIGRARFLLCGEGLHNHLAGATGTTAFTIFSGFHYPEVAAYATTRPIVAETTPACAPCFLKRPCPVPGKPCTTEITPERVVATIRASLPVSRPTSR